MDARLRWLVSFWGFVLLLPGLMALMAYCCLATATLSYPMQEDPQTLAPDVGVAALLAVTVGGGGATFYHGLQSEAKRPSQALRLPPLWALAGAFPLLVALGLGAQQSSMGAFLLFPVPLIGVCLIPPVGVLVWMMDGHPGTLTWRRATVAFVAGATVCVPLAWAVELALPGVALLLVIDLAQPVLDAVREFLEALAGLEVASALTSPGFLVALVGLGVVAPLVEELVKPLVTLPLIRLLKNPREALLLGAVAGAGFAALENVIYATAGLPIWAGILVLRALGAAVHPLCAGLVTVGWFRVLHHELGAGRRWLGGYGSAVAVHALWNGGSVLLLALAGARFFGKLPPEINVLGVTVASVLVALLAVEGVLAFVAARALSRGATASVGRQEAEEVLRIGGLSPDQRMAVWALVCLLTLLPVGLALLEAAR
jgi:RsiW-degrading membrane proteinase PrsW (M82 family)